MAHPNQPIWRLFSEIMARLPIMHPRAKNDSGQGLARLWKRTGADVEPLKHHNLNERYVVSMPLQNALWNLSFI
jgi:hypothetical protein